MRECSSKKQAFASASMALVALLEVHQKKAFHSKSGPINYYRCTICDAYHLTSKGTAHAEILHFLEGKQINLANEAAKWEKKWRK